ncbi:MAG: hypothetical protein RMK01_06205 [Thermomicrobium sp.]|nr:hypothetical protein [Thermomicrobium sp.]MDW8059650.1 hypothetical protein [Thermomicrobium sp.]
MRPLIAVLHERSRAALANAARYWELPSSGDPAELIGLLYPVLTDAWQLALGIERVGEQALPVLTVLAQHRSSLPPSQVGAAIRGDEGLTLRVLRQLYVAGIVASESSPEGPRVYLPNELIRLVLRLVREREQPLAPDAPLDALLERLSDHELLESAELYGMRVVPAVTTRQEASSFLLERLQRPETLAKARAALAPAALSLFDALRQAGGPLAVAEAQSRFGKSFGEFRMVVSELARWGLVWRSTTQGRLALLVPSVFARDTDSTRTIRSIGRAEPYETISPLAPLVDLVLLAAQALARDLEATLPSGAADETLPTGGRWFRDDPVTRPVYLDFLRRCARSLGLLRSDGGLDRTRLRSWLRLSFPEQARRVLRAWLSVPEPEERRTRNQLVQTLRELEPLAWYAADALVGSGSPEAERTGQRLLRELAWLAVVALGQTPGGVSAVQLTLWGSWLLGRTSDVPVPSLSVGFRLVGRGSFAIPHATPSTVWLAALLGDVEPAGSTLVSHVSAESVARYVRYLTTLEAGPRSPESLARAVLDELERGAGTELPPEWRDALLRLFTQSRPAVVRPALVLDFANAEDRERARAALRPAGWETAPLGTHQLLVWEPDPKRRARLLATLRRAGFIASWAGAHPRRTKQSAPSSDRQR